MAKKKLPGPAPEEQKKTKNPFVLAAVVSDRVQIQDVRIVHCRVEQAAPAGGWPRDFKASNEVEVDFRVDPDRNLIIVLPRFAFRARDDEDATGEQALSIECQFSLTYAAPSVSELPRLNIKAFAHTNGIFNAWPYWREFAQNMGARMGLPPLVIPVFRFSDPPARKTRGSE